MNEKWRAVMRSELDTACQFNNIYLRHIQVAAHCFEKILTELISFTYLSPVL